MANSITQLWYVKRLDFSFNDLANDWHKRIKAARDKVPHRIGSPENPITEAPETIPGIEWQAWGHMGTRYGFGRYVVGDEALAGWNEGNPATRPLDVTRITDR